jgi:hypothetical protein
MRQFILAAATVATFALVAAAPASAAIMGGPVKQNGQCWRSHAVGADASWGRWQACPQAASTPTTRKAARPRT